jgi:transposase
VTQKMTSRHGQRNGKGRGTSGMLTRSNPNVAGIDCGASHHVVAVPPDRDANPVQTFTTFTHDLIRLADWLQACGIASVAMESTGVYWIAVYEILEARGFTVLLVNARHLKNVPGRKSDVSDAEWIRDLHSVGLLRGSFRPTAAIVTLRAYLRHRQTLIESIGVYVQRMQKALIQMNVQLPRVVSDITGLTGLRIIRDIVAGQHDPAHLARARDPHCKASPAEIVAALTGHYLPEHVFALQQNLALYDMCQQQIALCDQAIEAHVHRLVAHVAPSPTPLPAARRRRRTANEPAFDIRTALHQLTGGVDLTQIDGILPASALKLVAEIGTDMSRWRTAKHFTSWLTLAPKNKISGGRLLSSRTNPSANRAAAILRMSAYALNRTQTALGAFYRRLAARIGKPQAITATARKLAILVYRALKGELIYADRGATAYDLNQRTRTLRHLRRRAANLGFELVSRHTGEVFAEAAGA